MISWLQFVFYPPKSALYIIVALVFRIIVNKKKSVTYCQQVLFIIKVFCVHKVFIALFVEYPLCVGRRSERLCRRLVLINSPCFKRYSRRIQGK